VRCRLDLENCPESCRSFIQIDAQYKRNQDSRDLPSAAELQKNSYQTLELLNYKIETFFSLLLIYQVTGMITGKLMIKKYYFI
jgi:hypothetical protein